MSLSQTSILSITFSLAECVTSDWLAPTGLFPLQCCKFLAERYSCGGGGGGGGQLNVTLLFSLVIGNRNRWQCSVLLQVRDGLTRNYRLTFPVRIVSLIITRADCLMTLTVCRTQCVHALLGLVSESTGKPDGSSVCFFQSFYKLNANIHRGT